MNAQASAKAKKPNIQEDSIERHNQDTKSVNGSLTGVSSDVLSTLWNDLLTGGSKDVSTQLFGGSSHSQELQPGQEMSLKKQEKKSTQPTEAHMEYFREVKNADVSPARQADMATEKRVDDIRREIKQLMQATKELSSTFKSAQIEQQVVKAGTYHETLLTFILFLVRSAKVKIQEGSSWLNVAKSKKQQRQYQSMAKKHGTSFTLSNERTTATQTG